MDSRDIIEILESTIRHVEKQRRGYIKTAARCRRYAKRRATYNPHDGWAREHDNNARRYAEGIEILRGIAETLREEES